MPHDQPSPYFPHSASPQIAGEILERLTIMQVRAEDHRMASDQRHKDLKGHLDTRIADLKDSLGDRIDGVESRVAHLERAPRKSAWWQDINPKERMLWVMVAMAAMLAIREPQRAMTLVENIAVSLAK